MKRKIIFFLILSLSSVIAGFLFFREGVENILYSKIEEIEKSLPKIVQSADRKKVELPPPLKLLVEEKEPGFLTRQGIVDQTNIKRGLKGLPPLKENALLDRSAQFKAEDMLKNQYFAHQSPLGEGVGDLANKFGYQYLNDADKPKFIQFLKKQVEYDEQYGKKSKSMRKWIKKVA